MDKTYFQTLDPTSSSVIFIKVYKNVKNVAEIRQNLLNGTLQCCVCKSDLILDPLQVVVAANKAIMSEKLTTKSVYTEILFNLSVSKNITQSLQKFGIDDSVNSIVVAVIAKDGENVSAQKVFSKIDGEELEPLSLKNMANEAEIRKLYKISDTEFQELSLLDSVITRIAAKDLL